MKPTRFYLEWDVAGPDDDGPDLRTVDLDESTVDPRPAALRKSAEHGVTVIVMERVGITDVTPPEDPPGLLWDYEPTFVDDVTARNDGPITLQIPGAFDGYFSGSSIGQGIPEQWDPTSAGARVLSDAYVTARSVRRGRAVSIHLRGLTVDACRVLRQIAEDCLEVNRFGDKDPTEMRAARIVLERAEEAIAMTGADL